ncbi:MAG: hypothetical protein KDC27_21415 [Acidobacteria bacterium]|nr:hypothetical protein [Acidobacteriota bacterium]
MTLKAPHVCATLALLFALGAAPSTVRAQQLEAGGSNLYTITPALEKALSAQRYFSPEDPETQFERSRRRWRKAWLGSVAAFAVANVLDIHSSHGKMELNPLLRTSDGSFSVGRAAAVKGGLGFGFVALQGWMIHRNQDKNLYKSFTFANAAASGGLSALAVRNYGIPGR